MVYLLSSEGHFQILMILPCIKECSTVLLIVLGFYLLFAELLSYLKFNRNLAVSKGLLKVGILASHWDFCCSVQVFFSRFQT